MNQSIMCGSYGPVPEGQQIGESVTCGPCFSASEGPADWWKYYLRSLSQCAGQHIGGFAICGACPVYLRSQSIGGWFSKRDMQGA